MKHIEVSKKITLDRPVSAEDFKETLVDYLEKKIEIEHISGNTGNFSIQGATGAPSSLTRHAQIDVNIHIRHESEGKVARVIMSGYVRPARSLIFFYSFAFVLLLLVGLLPGFVSTSAETSGAVDALFFLIFGIFIVQDINAKMVAPREYLETVLESLNTTFG